MVIQLFLVAEVLLEQPHRLVQAVVIPATVGVLVEKVVIVVQSWAHPVMDMQAAEAEVLVDMLEQEAQVAMLLVHLQLLVKLVQLAQVARPAAAAAAEICVTGLVKDPTERAANIQVQVPLEMAAELDYMVQM
jgi:hypothetical protein